MNPRGSHGAAGLCRGHRDTSSVHPNLRAATNLACTPWHSLLARLHHLTQLSRDEGCTTEQQQRAKKGSEELCNSTAARSKPNACRVAARSTVTRCGHVHLPGGSEQGQSQKPFAFCSPSSTETAAGRPRLEMIRFLPVSDTC